MSDKKSARQAVKWVVRLEKSRHTQTLKAFHKWMDASPQHTEYYLRVMTHLKATPITGDPREWSKRTMQVILAGDRNNEASISKRHWLLTGPVHSRAAITAGAFIALAIGTYWGSRVDDKWHSYRAPIEHADSVQLKEGSTLELGAGSSAEVRITNRGREVRSVEGRAMFAVVRDPVRPFVVTVPGAAIEVIGTQFGLVAEPSRTTVDVREGALRLRSAHHDASIDIVAGSRATIRPDGSINVVAGNAIQNVPLGLVAEALNKHHRVPQIRVEGSACEKRIGMNWAWDDPEEFVRMLTNDLGFSATRNGDEVWIRYGHDPVPVGPAPCAKGVISLEVP